MASGEMIGQYEKRRIGQVNAFTVANELTVLRHMLRLAKRWGYLEHVPDVDMPKKPKARQRYLSAEEIPALLKACATSKNRHLGDCDPRDQQGMRKAELLGLTWERVGTA